MPAAWQPPKSPALVHWTPRPEHPFEARLHADNGVYGLWIAEHGWYRIDPESPLISVPVGLDVTRREVRLWGIPVALCAIRRGAMAMHAASVEVDGRALLLGAPGRFGKTTLAAAFLSRGYRLLSEDLTICEMGGPPSALPGPALIRMRRDSFDRLPLPGTEVVAEDADRIHLTFQSKLRGEGHAVPVAGVVLLRHSEEGSRLEPIGAEESLRDLWALNFHLPTDSDRERCFQSVAGLAALVPVWNLHRRLEFESLSSLVDTIVSTCLEASS